MTRLRPTIADWVLHDLRRYMRSGLSRLGISQTVAEQCLGHLAGGLIGVYVLASACLVAPASAADVGVKGRIAGDGP